MSPEQIKEIVKMTINELMSDNLINSYNYINKTVSTRLIDYFNGKEDKDLLQALRNISDDQYIDIIYLHYRDELTLEYIAEYFDKDTSTIKRNKKRIITSIYSYLY